MTCSVSAFPVPDFRLIFAPLKDYNEPEILRSQLSQLGLISAEVGQDCWDDRGSSPSELNQH